MRAKKRSTKAGLPPGSLVHVGMPSGQATKITVFHYNDQHFEESSVDNVDALQRQDLGNHMVNWVNMDGLENVMMLEKIGVLYDMHPLTLEDILNTDHRPKAEDYGHYFYIVFKMLSYDDKSHRIDAEQVSVVLGRGYVLSFQEKEGDVFGPLRQSLRQGKGRVRKMGADYLAYSLLDAVVDNYFCVLERVGERIELLEDLLVRESSSTTLREVHNLKREMIFLRRAVWPLREVVNNLEKSETAFLDRTTDLYLRDVYDHIFQVIDTTEIYREMLSGMLDIYLSSINNRMNEVMKVLTIIATLFIPLTFITGLYGMNFHYMPELEWPFGYPMVLLIMVAVASMMLLFFKRKNWF